MVETINMAIKETSKLTAHLIAIIITNDANKINKWNVIKTKHIIRIKDNVIRHEYIIDNSISNKNISHKRWMIE